MNKPKVLVWMSRHAPLEVQKIALEKLFPGHQLLIETRPFSSAEQIVERFQAVGGDEMVVVAPWSVMRQLIRLGIKPIYAEMKPASVSDPEAVTVPGRAGKRRYYKFVGFSYCTDVTLKLEAIPLPVGNLVKGKQTVLLDSNGVTKSIIKP